MREFREFIVRGDVLDLVVSIVTGSAFISVVNQVVQGLITLLIGWIVAMITGTPDLEGALSILDWSPTKGVTSAFGNVISVVITFLIAGSILFLVIKAANRAKNLRTKEVEGEVEEAPTAEDYLSGIRDPLAKQVAKDNTHPVE